MTSDERRTRVQTARPADGVIQIELDGPRTLNALGYETFHELEEAVAEADADPDAAVLIITGAGRGFCSGLDITLASEVAEMPVEEMLHLQERAARSITKVQRSSKVVIAAIGGPAAGAGFSLALAADLRLADPTATFSGAFIQIGLTGGDCGSSWLLPRAIGMTRAADILLTGRTVEAGEAGAIGLVNRVVGVGELQKATLELAAQLQRHSPLALSLTKQALQTNIDAPSLAAAIELENRNQVLASRSRSFLKTYDAYIRARDDGPPRA